MTDILATQLPFQQFASNMSLHVKRCNFQEVRQNSAGTTRSGTPESKESYTEPCDDFNYGRQTSGFHPGEEGFEIGVKPKKRQFKTEEERQRFVDNYKKKIKTELCKNYELRGWCKFGDNVNNMFLSSILILFYSVLLHMESTSFKRRPICIRNTKPSLASSSICLETATMAIDANTFIVKLSCRTSSTTHHQTSSSILSECLILIPCSTRCSD